MAITGSYSAATRKLAALGDGVANSILFTRDVAGTLFINGGAVVIAGGPATVANTDLIEASGFDGDDTIRLNELSGILPSADLFGGNGNDTLTGGSNADKLKGEAGADLLFGSGGADQLFGGTEVDVLTGGLGDDQLFGEDGNDRMIWNSGDGSDTMEGGAGTDAAEVHGGTAGEDINIIANGARLTVEDSDPNIFSLDLGSIESLVLDGGGGNDTIATSGDVGGIVVLKLDGGAGDDRIDAGNGPDTLTGGIGNDYIRGAAGNDLALLGDGDDIFQWDVNDGSDTVEGGNGTDLFFMSGNTDGETFTLSAVGGRVQLVRNASGFIIMDFDDVENFTINALTGLDSIIVDDLAATDASNVTINLAAGTGGFGGDAYVDAVVANGGDAADIFILLGNGDSYTVLRSAKTIVVNWSEAADQLRVNGGGGNDTINALALAAGAATLAVDGGAGNDSIAGSPGVDDLFGNDGNDLIDGNAGDDLANLSLGDDVFNWDPGDGNDTLEGGLGADEVRFNGSNADETIGISANGFRTILTRDVDLVTLDTNDIQTFTVKTIGGADNIVIGDLSGTTVSRIVVDLAASGGGSDGQADVVIIDATGTGEAMSAATTAPGIVTVTGLSFTVEVRNFDNFDQLVINGLAGNDTIETFDLGSGISFSFNGGGGQDEIFGGDERAIFDGGNGNDYLDGGGGSDTLLGGAGIDYVRVSGRDALLDGGADSDVLDIDLSGEFGDITLDISNPALDQFVLGTIIRNFEQLVFIGAPGVNRVTGGALADQITGAAQDDILNGGGGPDSLDGRAGADTMRGGPGNDSYVVDNAGDRTEEVSVADGVDLVESSVNITLAANIELLFLTGSARINGTGNALANQLTGNVAGNRLDGAGGADVMRGGPGGDLYIVNDVGDVALEGLLTDGLDTVQSSVSFTLTGFVENLILTGIAVNGTGNALANQITGNAAANRLDGGAAADVMTGGAGNDTFIADASGDRAIELAAGDGTDKVEASASYQLGAFIENLTLTGAAAINGTGNSLANSIIGNDSANILNGSGGADTMRGGLGNDRYIVDNVGDRAIETDAGGGVDSVESRVNFILAAFVENLTLTGIALLATGNALDNFIVGNAASNTIDGGAGADTMRGNGGNDTYIVDNALDRAIETDPAGGTDLVKSNVSFTLGNFVENLTLTGAAVITGTGNSLANLITGNGAANSLDGLGGADTMRGGAGNDIYIVNDVGDRAIETSAGNGIDSVQSNVSFTLGGFVENLSLTGGAAINGTGNSAANAVTGNGGANLINGMAGNDTLQGGGGADDFLFTTALGATNVDHILDLQVGVDDIVLENAVFTGLAVGALAPGAFRTGAAAIDADDRILYDSATGALYFDADGSGAGAAVQFATLQAGLALGASECQVI